MKNRGYDQFFKAAKNARTEPLQPVTLKKSPAAAKASSEEALKQALLARLHARRQAQQKKRQKTPWTAVGFTVGGLFLAGLVVAEPSLLDKMGSFVEIGWLSLAGAEDKAPAKTAETKNPKEAKTSTPGDHAAADKAAEKKDAHNEDISHFSKLNERKKDLDLREAELNELEEELQRQKIVVEERIRKLEEIREQIAGILKDRVTIDEEKVTKLVEFYSNMKPKQAADIIGTLNEDLAVEVLGRMKKKNAAEVMNLLKPDKAQVLSEKFAGYKRR